MQTSSLTFRATLFVALVSWPQLAGAQEPAPPAPLDSTPIPPPPPEYAPPPPPLPASDRASRRPIHLGLEAYFGPSPRNGDSSLQVMGTAELSYTVTPRLTLGVNHIGPFFAKPGGSPGTYAALTAAPFVEAYDFIRPDIQFFGQFGLPLQVAVGENSARGVGVAPYGGIGMRFWLSPGFSLGLGARLYYNLSRDFQFGTVVANDRGVAWNGGASFHFHFLPRSL